MNAAKTLYENKCDLLCIDSDKEIVAKAKEFFPFVVMGDCRNKEVLQSLNIGEFEIVIVTISGDMASSILVSLYLMELNVKRVIARALSDDHAKVLSKIGISEILFPEKDTAVRLANKISFRNVVDYLPLSNDYGIVEINPPQSFKNKSLMELKIANRFNCQIIGIRELDAEGKESALKIPPRADDVIPSNSVLIIIGKNDNIDSIKALG